MPKVKTKSAVKKRFKLSGSGKVMGAKAANSHLMSSKSKRQKAKAGKLQQAPAGHTNMLKRLLNN